MRVSITGTVLEVVPKQKEDKKFIDIMVYQSGEKINSTLRVPEGTPLPKVGEQYTKEGSLITWATKSGSVGMMVSSIPNKY